MTRNLRLSKSQFLALSIKTTNNATNTSDLRKKNAKSRPCHSIVRAVNTAVPVVSAFNPGGFVLHFTGARLATLNDLFAMTHFERRIYRKAWHKLVSDLVMESFHGTPPIFNRVAISVSRVGPRLVDPDNIIPKQPIDALRYAGLLADDTAQVVCRLDISQQIGPYAVAITIRPAISDSLLLGRLD